MPESTPESTSESVAVSESTFEEEINKSGSLCYTIKGYSMLPLLRQHKDIVVIEKPAGRLKRYDVALYSMPSGKYILHRVLRQRENDYVICGDNCFRREFGIKDSYIIGVMTEFVRNGKTRSVKSVSYRIYSHLIADLYFIKAPVLRIRSLIKGILCKIRRMLTK